jgi:hypothetical protein
MGRSSGASVVGLCRLLGALGLCLLPTFSTAATSIVTVSIADLLRSAWSARANLLSPGVGWQGLGGPSEGLHSRMAPDTIR